MQLMYSRFIGLTLCLRCMPLQGAIANHCGDSNSCSQDQKGQLEIEESSLLQQRVHVSIDRPDNEYFESEKEENEEEELLEESFDEYEYGPKDDLEVDLINEDSDEEELHDGITCDTVDDCIDDCSKQLNRGVCMAEANTLACEDADSGKKVCGAYHFMKNNSHIKVDMLSYLRKLSELPISGNATATARPRSKENLTLVSVADHEMHEATTGCSNCACWGESAAHCAKNTIKNAWRCGVSVFQACRYHGRRRWWGRVSCNLNRVAKSCSVWGPCSFPSSLDGCVKQLIKGVAADASNLVNCVVDAAKGKCGDFGCYAKKFAEAHYCPMELMDKYEQAIKNKALEVAGVPAPVRKILTMSLQDRLEIAQKAGAFGLDMVKETASEIGKTSNYEQGSMCLPSNALKLTMVVPTDCGFFSNAGKIFSQIHQAGHWFKKARDSLQSCAGNTINSLPFPFHKLRTYDRVCLPKLVDVMVDKVKQNQHLKDIVKKLEDMMQADERFGAVVCEDKARWCRYHSWLCRNSFYKSNCKKACNTCNSLLEDGVILTNGTDNKAFVQLAEHMRELRGMGGTLNGKLSILGGVVIPIPTSFKLGPFNEVTADIQVKAGVEIAGNNVQGLLDVSVTIGKVRWTSHNKAVQTMTANTVLSSDFQAIFDVSYQEGAANYAVNPAVAYGGGKIDVHARVVKGPKKIDGTLAFGIDNSGKSMAGVSVAVSMCEASDCTKSLMDSMMSTTVSMQWYVGKPWNPFWR